MPSQLATRDEKRVLLYIQFVASRSGKSVTPADIRFVLDIPKKRVAEALTGLLREELVSSEDRHEQNLEGMIKNPNAPAYQITDKGIDMALLLRDQIVDQQDTKRIYG